MVGVMHSRGVASFVIILTCGMLFANLSWVRANDNYPSVSDWDVWNDVVNSHQYMELDLYPGITEIYFPYVILPREVKDVVHYLLLGHIKATGNYTLMFHVPYTNPYDKYNHWVGWYHFAGTDPSDLPKGVIDPLLPDTWNPVAFIVPRRISTPPGYQSVAYHFEAQKTGDIYCFADSHSIITDINGDGKVDIKDVALVSKNYGKRITWKDPEYAYDMDCDEHIFMRDIILISLDFGRIIPP